MNIQKLLKAQAELDNRIVENHNLQGVDLLDKKILALQVELGELANEWQMFKFWKDNPKPNVNAACLSCCGLGRRFVGHCESCNGTGAGGNPLLEEYVDCLHFILSIGNEFDYKVKSNLIDRKNSDLISLFDQVYQDIQIVKISIKNRHLTSSGMHVAEINYKAFMDLFYSLGKQLGFTWEQIEQAYYSKNQVNHERQESGY